MKFNSCFAILLSLIICISLSAQPSIIKQKTLGGDHVEGLGCADILKDGSVIVGGYSYSNASRDKTENNRGTTRTADYWIVKLNRQGAVEWDKTIGGSDLDILSDIKHTKDGGFIVCGGSKSGISGEKTGTNIGDYDGWVIKFGAAGNIQWQKTIGTADRDEFRAIEQTSDKGYIIAGNSKNDYWMVKLDSLGNIEFQKNIEALANDYATCVVQTIGGGYLLGGYSNSSAGLDKSENYRGTGFYVFTNDMWIVRLDKEGNKLWDKTIGGSDEDQLLSIKQTPGGGFILGGGSYSPVSSEKTANNINGSYDCWLVKVDNKGHIEWDQTIGGNSYDEINSLDVTSDDGFILGCSSASNISGNKTENNRGTNLTATDYWVVKTNSAGIVQWDKTIGGIHHDVLHFIREAATNKFLLSGTSQSGKSGDKSEGLRGEQDYWTVQLNYNPVTAVASASPQTAMLTSKLSNDKPGRFSIYPNPASNVVHISTTDKAVITLIDEFGNVILTKTINGKGDMNIANLHTGTYYLISNASNSKQKLIVIK